MANPSFPEMLIGGKDGNEEEMFLINGYAINTSRPAILKWFVSKENKYNDLESGKHPVSFLDEILEAIAGHSPQCIHIADFGAADGRASLSLINELIAKTRSRMGEHQQILVYYNDEPLNDFNILTKVLTGTEEERLATDGNVYCTLLPRSMYEQCLPDNSLNLAFTSFAVHMLSESLCKIKNGVFLQEADDEDKTLIEEQARKEWRTFVTSRGRELKPGGYLVVVTPSCNEGNLVTCHMAGGPVQLGCLVRNMFEEGLITQEEYRNTNFNTQYMRTEADFRDPFTNSQPDAKGLGLELVSVRGSTHYIRHPVYDIVNKDIKEKEKYAKHIVAGIRPWMYYSIYGDLARSRTETEKQAIVEDYFGRIYRHAYSHSDHKPYMVVSEVIIRKNNKEC